MIELRSNKVIYKGIQNVSLKKMIIGVIVTVLIILVFAIAYTSMFIEENSNSMQKNFLGYKDDYSKQVSAKVTEYRKVMGILGVKNDIKRETFRINVTDSEMVLVSKRLRRIINETLTYYFENNIEFDYGIYSFLPPDGNIFRSLDSLDYDKMRAGQSYSYSNTTRENYISFYGIINNFILDSHDIFIENGKGICYQELKIKTSDLFKNRTQSDSVNFANVYVYTNDTNSLVYSSDKDYIDIANTIANQMTTVQLDQSGKDLQSYEGTFYSTGELSNVDAHVVYLFNTDFSKNLRLSNDFTASLMVFITASIVCILIVLSVYYLGFANNIMKLTKKMDRYGKDRSGYVQTFVGKNEIAMIDKHLVSMYDQMVELIKEVYLNKSEALNAHNQALIASINPHFLYNTLNSISSMATFEDAQDTVRMIECLSRMFRYITSNQTDMVLLSSEIEHINRYVEIQQIRYNDEFTYEVDIEPDLAQLYVPKFILQPLVENFFKHGFNVLNRKFKLKLSATIEGQDLFINIYDNGKGVLPQRLQEIKEMLSNVDYDIKESVGIQNVNNRIKFMYGDLYGIDIESVIGEFTCITVKVIAKREGGKDSV